MFVKNSWNASAIVTKKKRWGGKLGLEKFCGIFPRYFMASHVSSSRFANKEVHVGVGIIKCFSSNGIKLFRTNVIAPNTHFHFCLLSSIKVKTRPDNINSQLTCKHSGMIISHRNVERNWILWLDGNIFSSIRVERANKCVLRIFCRFNVSWLMSPNSQLFVASTSS